MSLASQFAQKHQQAESARPMLVIPGYADPAAVVTDDGKLSLPHDTVFDAVAAVALARWIRDTFT